MLVHRDIQFRYANSQDMRRCEDKYWRARVVASCNVSEHCAASNFVKYQSLLHGLLNSHVADWLSSKYDLEGATDHQGILKCFRSSSLVIVDTSTKR